MVRRVIKKAMYQGGFLSAMHRIRNTSTLTVVLFHKVLPEGDPEWSVTDPEWSVTTRFFEQCLKFFKKHYNVVSFPRVQEGYAGKRPLPPRAMLITFDDGWRNNLIHAAPVLEEYDLPSLLFVTTGAIGKSVLSWQEILYGRWRSGDLAADDLNQLCGLLDFDWSEPIASAEDLARFIRKLSELPLMQRSAAESLCHQWADEFPNTPYMMKQEELLELQEFGFHLGTHGVTHDALTSVEDPMQELSQSRHDLHFAAKLDRLPESMAFPHGVSTDELIGMAANAGYGSVFTGKKCLNSTIGDGKLRSSLEDQTRNIGLEKQVMFLGDRRDIPNLLSGMDLFVLSSRHEGYSISLLEACASGLPIIATDVGGNAEIVTQGINGYLVESGNASALSTTLIQALEDKRNLRQMGHCSRLWAEKYGSIGAMADEYEKLYE